MTWLLTLYPPRWRRRYEAEFLALVAPLPFSIGTVIDILGGAIDAWTEPQSHLSPRGTSHQQGETVMLAKAMRLRCAGYGTTATVADALKAAGIIIGGTLATVLVASLVPRDAGGHSYRTAVMANSWLIFFIISMRYTTLKGWPGRTQAVFMGVLISVIVGLTVGS